MSYRVGTPNYNLPQTEGTDKRDWSDTNQAFLTIDTAIKNAVDTSASASSAAATAQQTADGATTAATHAQTDATTAQTLATSAGELAAVAKNKADANELAIAQLQVAKIATSPSTGTLGAKLNSLFSAAHALTNQKLSRSYLIVRGSNNEVAAIIPCQGLSFDGSAPIYMFSGVTVGVNNGLAISCAKVMSSTSVYGNASVTSTGYTFSDYTGIENTQYFELWA